MEYIKRAVAEHYGMDVATLCGPGRSLAIARPRLVAMWMMRRRTHHSWRAISNACGRTDHTTAVYAAQRTSERLRVDSGLRKDILAILRRVREIQIERQFRGEI
jgi:chromosomal replication initiator protein